MSASTPVPDDLLAWVADHLPGVEQAGDVSWPRENSRVWRVAASSMVAFVKLSPTRADYEREVIGYDFTARALARHEAPRLLAADPALLAILTSSLPGRVVRGLPLEPAAEHRVHALAGKLLRRWHDRSTAATEQDRRAVGASIRGQAQEAACCLQHIGAHLNPEQHLLVEAAALDLPELASQLPLVYLHGDYATRNWLWDADTARHGLIDFAMARHGLTVEEFVWLYGAVWPTRPDLRSTYLAAYGRALSDVEERVLQLLTTRLGVSYLHTGLTRGRPDLAERGHLILDRMTRQPSQQ